MSKKQGTIGSISTGTMRPEDLIPTFLGELERLNPTAARLIHDEYPDLSLAWIVGNPFEADLLLNECLFEELDQAAPQGAYFGSHPGDGADFGFWEYDSALDPADETSDDEGGPDASSDDYLSDLDPGVDW